MSILGKKSLNSDFDFKTEMLRVQRLAGRGPWRQAIDILSLALRRPRFGPADYFLYGFYRPEFTARRRRDFIGFGREYQFHADLTGPGFEHYVRRLRDKITTECELQAKGIATTRTRALFSPNRPADFTGILLQSVDDMTAYLSNPGHFPLFGKPQSGAHSTGAVMMTGLAEDGQIQLADGRQCTPSALAQEILSDYATGYLFQSPLTNHALLQPHFGLATASTRICTILGPDGPEVLYIVQRLPSGGAMHDGSVAKGAGTGRRGFARVDLQTGAITAIRVRGAPYLPAMDHWNDPSTPLMGVILPHFAAAKELAIKAHRAIGQIAVVGFDVVLEQDGPCIMEANEDPFTICFQAANDTGILSDENRLRFDAARVAARMGRPSA